MLGAIVGDIVGSVYEWNNIKTKDFPLFRDDCFFTDDTIMTCAVADAIMEGNGEESFINSIKKYGRMYPDADYGGRFRQWLMSYTTKPYGSYGNGSAMRVAPCGWIMDCGYTARTGMWPSNGRECAKMSAAVTHNHPEGIKGAMAVADAIFMCRYYFGAYAGDYEVPIDDQPDEIKMRIKEHIEQEYGYNLSQTLDEIRPTYQFDETCQGTVPQAIIAFLESTDFEDAIRNAISLGGDSDTLAAITGAIAEAAYGIPDWIKEKALSYLDEPMLDVYNRFEDFIHHAKLMAYNQKNRNKLGPWSKFVWERKDEGKTDEEIAEILYFEYVNDNISLEVLEAVLFDMVWEFTSEFKALSNEEKKTAGLDGIDHLFRKMGFQGENEIEEGTMFSECTKAQLEWAKTQDRMTEYYIKIWQNPEENAMQLCDPMWINGKWEDCIW